MEDGGCRFSFSKGKNITIPSHSTKNGLSFLTGQNAGKLDLSPNRKKESGLYLSTHDKYFKSVGIANMIK